MRTVSVDKDSSCFLHLLIVSHEKVCETTGKEFSRSIETLGPCDRWARILSAPGLLNLRADVQCLKRAVAGREPRELIKRNNVATDAAEKLGEFPQNKRQTLPAIARTSREDRGLLLRRVRPLTTGRSATVSLPRVAAADLCRLAERPCVSDTFRWRGGQTRKPRCAQPDD